MIAYNKKFLKLHLKEFIWMKDKKLIYIIFEGLTEYITVEYI